MAVKTKRTTIVFDPNTRGKRGFKVKGDKMTFRLDPASNQFENVMRIIADEAKESIAKPRGKPTESTKRRRGRRGRLFNVTGKLREGLEVKRQRGLMSRKVTWSVLAPRGRLQADFPYLRLLATTRIGKLKKLISRKKVKQQLAKFVAPQVTRRRVRASR